MTTNVPSTGVDKGWYRNMNSHQNPDQYHSPGPDECETLTLSMKDRQEYKQQQNPDQLVVPDLMLEEHQKGKQQGKTDASEAPSDPLDEEKEPEQNQSLDEHTVPNIPPDNEKYSHPFHGSPITAALKALVDRNISMVEYGAQVQFRCGYEEVPVVVEWAIPDEQLSLASQILADHNFPLLSSGTRWWFGYWDTGCFRHGLDRAGWMCVHLLPLSLVGLTLEDTTEVPSIFAPEINILTLKPPRYMLSLIHHLRKLRIGDASRLRVEKDLLTFISSYILHGPPGDINAELLQHLVEQESKEDKLKKLDEGVKFMKTWEWGNVEETDLALAERVVRDCQYVEKLTEVIEDPASP
ncbi:uncharacterized protein N7500_002839 [Penicillium coprophilum]|uniref:uncharacterized protein n=1 Tax=Penicillium coprophilum TaxID=36646 RepID=UPI00238D7F70|nr:uncharacterized protein N7500_002839 [Penicillium coprophilum]KAJ5170056.1 hypothetical protein N7500_002839 [Penicillium coprophilum]